LESRTKPPREIALRTATIFPTIGSATPTRCAEMRPHVATGPDLEPRPRTQHFTSVEIILKGAIKTMWDRVADHFNFVEVSQPTHTHYFIPRNMNYDEMRTSKIDKIFISLDPADATVITPIAHIPDIPYNILRIAKAISKDKGRPSRYVCDWVSDHLPVTAQFMRNSRNNHFDNKISRWLGDDNAFVENVDAKIDIILADPNSDPFSAFDGFTKALYDEAKSQKKRNKDASKNKHNELSSIHTCIKALKLINATVPDVGKIKDLFDTHIFLAPHIPQLDILPLNDAKIWDITNSLLVKQGSDDSDYENFFEKHLDDFLNNPPSSTKAPRVGTRLLASPRMLGQVGT
jgi:hypothetical protein